MNGHTDRNRSHLSVQRIAIVGLGLIGGSIARALRAQGFAGEIAGVVASADDAERALALGLVDRAETDLAAATRAADLVIVAVPVGAMASVFAELSDVVDEQAIITDVGSTKVSVLATARQHLRAHLPRFVPGHPISGTEHSGIEAGFASLFERRRVILTPTADTRPAALAEVRALWQLLGARVSTMDAAHHDEVLAATSHLPHLLAYALVDSLATQSGHEEIFDYAAGGFRDFTRIASSDPALWRDIVRANQQPLLAALDRFVDDLASVRQHLADDDGQALLSVFSRAKTARDRFAHNFEARQP